MAKIIIYFIFIIVGAISVFLLNVLLIERLVIPDVCYYHSNDTTFLFDVFYSFPSSEGGHPIASNFNIILSLVVGGIIGFYFARRKVMRY